MSDRAYDVAVIGLGAMGSAAAAVLARRGLRVLGLDQHPPAHNLGASHGGSRIIRSAYFEGSTYVPLVRRSEQLWRALEEETGQRLLTITGGIFVGSASGPVVAGSRASAEAHAVEHEVLDAAALRRRWPVFTPREDEAAVHEPGAGVLHPERGVGAHLAVAARCGAELRHGVRVLRWSAGPGGVTISSSEGSYTAGALVVAAGAWSGSLLRDLALPLRVERRVQHWFEPRDAAGWRQAPVWIWQRPDGASAYGFPLIDGACKVGMHEGLEPGLAVEADHLDRYVTDAEVEGLRADVTGLVPGVAAGRHLRHAACTYTLTPDEHFIVDRHPDHPNVAVACGFSGHGYKFAPVLGEVLADLATGSPVQHDVAAFSVERAAIG